ncbi:MAG: beta-ketoacyl-ACP reductase [Planctomycetota bacterium]|nr:MAG: beta-ketoacyl-ACP reductase [Planctomycetota bacterium]
MAVFSDLVDKVVFISGASKGIGLSIAEAFAAQGSKVIMNSRSIHQDHESVEKVKQAASENGFTTIPLALPADTSSPEAVKELYKTIKNHNDFGTVDIGINNAGISKDGLFIRQKEADWDETININLKGIRNCCQEQIKMMRKTGGSIINMSSVIGQHGNTGQSAYAASKAGVIALTMSLAEEYARSGIRLNSIAPGYINTEMTDNVNDEAKTAWEKLIPMGRIGNSEEVAQVALFLASNCSSYMTGQTIGVDGGWFRR